jgi:hypothetical protein
VETLGQHSLYWMATVFALVAAVIIGFMRRGDERSVIEAKLPQVQPLSPSPKGSSAD